MSCDGEKQPISPFKNIIKKGKKKLVRLLDIQ